MTDQAPADPIVTCDACPVLCRIRPGLAGACDRYGNTAGRLTRLDPLIVLSRDPARVAIGDWDGNPLAGRDLVVTAIGAGTTYPDYKPAPSSSAARSTASTPSPSSAKASSAIAA